MNFSHLVLTWGNKFFDSTFFTFVFLSSFLSISLKWGTDQNLESFFSYKGVDCPSFRSCLLFPRDEPLFSRDEGLHKVFGYVIQSSSLSLWRALFFSSSPQNCLVYITWFQAESGPVRKGGERGANLHT